MSEIKVADSDQLIGSNQIEKVSTIGVLDSEGSERPFGELIRHGTKIVIFIRHFNCGFCQDYLIATKDRMSKEKLGDREIIVIGCGHWSVIKPYKELLDYPFEIYSDDTRQLFDQLGMIISNGWKMGIKSFLQGGKISQIGGEFIFKDNECKFAHRMQNTRDHVGPEDLEKLMLQY
ncbi:uncharacterized protein MELLADRAFT_66932 [Melampsora larici-populina 98AG31]|uniref:Alkyl hydroperoxide reductase subunit C/ Thiol specific antioxidant domain-containing protein n=1 Tax=Melampsora larici-populina (strain 98AG31 / pathotype 3-4-7) TaxID=747676 RepID=F4S156_MELLP|nr:uncharacterized protein MELLADRAFT_66932 [Melampsora larici-populina 98AG31]EGG01626.1 hypothetical protein MELLADRAFT_66932 [Melampsora larici-populina 98AG31]